jgi:hypothetical protein
MRLPHPPREIPRGRCPRTHLTRGEFELMAAVCVGSYDDRYRIWNGILRALRIRGLLAGDLSLTENGRKAMADTSFVSRQFSQFLLSRNGAPRRPAW